MVYLPWRAFVPVKRARVDPTQPKLDPSRVRQLGLVLSRFEFNGLANPNYRPGKFSLKVGRSPVPCNTCVLCHVKQLQLQPCRHVLQQGT